MYEQGFAQVAGKYNALNKEMTHASNQQFKDQFLKQANENLKNLSAMDLSLPQNVQAAASVFQPFYTNKLALQDMSFTQQMNNEKMKAESDRNREGGKFYNQASLDYINLYQDAFRNDSPESVQRYAQNMPVYTQYADYTKKFTEALEKIKPQLLERALPMDNGYIKEVKLSQYDIQSVKDILEATLTPQEKQQLRLEGIVRKSSQLANPSAAQQIFSEYTVHANDGIQGIDAKINDLKLKRDLARKKEDKDLIDAKITRYEDAKRSIIFNASEFEKMDSFQKRRYLENLAGDIYFDDKISEFAVAKSKTDTIDSVKYSNDQAFWNRVEDARNRAEAEEKKKEEQSLYVGDPSVVRTTDKTKLSVGSLDNDISSITTKIASLEGSIIGQHLIGTTNKKITPDHIREFVKDWDEKTKNIEQVKLNGVTTFRYKDSKKELTPAEYQDYKVWLNYSKEFSDLDLQKQGLLAMQNTLESEVKDKGKADYEKLEQLSRNFNGGKNISFTAPDGTKQTFTPVEFIRKIQAGVIDYDVRNENPSAALLGSSNPRDYYTVTVGGKKYTRPVSMFSSNDDVEKLANTIQAARRTVLNSEPANNIKKLRNSIYENSVIDNDMIRTYNTENKQFKVIKGVVEQKLPNSKFAITGELTSSGETVIAFDPKEKITEESLTQIMGGTGNVRELSPDRYAVMLFNNGGLMGQMSTSQKSLFNVLTNKFKGEEVQPNTYTFQAPALRIDGTPYSIYIRRVLYETPTSNQGIEAQNYQYYILDKDYPYINLYGLPFQTASAVVAAVTELNADPEGARQLIENARKASGVQ
jgi:hypothetical protein